MVFNAVAYLESLFTAPAEPVGNAVDVILPISPALTDQGIGPDDLPGDWRCVFEERAAIMEDHGELPRELAEAKALDETVRMMRGPDLSNAAVKTRG